MHSKYKDDLGVCEEALRELGIAVPGDTAVGDLHRGRGGGGEGGGPDDGFRL